MRRTILAAISVLLLGATAAAAGPIPAIPLEAGAQDGVVYVFRTNDVGMSMRAAVVEIDGRPVATLGMNGCTAVRVPAGTHLLALVWKGSRVIPATADANSRVAATVEAGRRHYYRFEVTSPDVRIGAAVKTTWKLYEMEERRGAGWVGNCAYQAPKGN